MQVFAENSKGLKIGILSGTKSSILQFKGENGKYALIADNNTILESETALNLELSAKSLGIEVKNQGKLLGIFNNIQISGIDSSNSLKIKTLSSQQFMTYDGDFNISKSGNGLKIINMVNTEEYVSTVMESEAGNAAAMEYLKLQSILCRTFAGKNKGKHLAEGFDLCDKVHCQVYQGKKGNNPNILHAVKATKGKVIIDQSKHLILSAYHSNCGGQTINSEDVWNTPLPYLRSVKDSFCQTQPNAIWKQKIPLKAWESRYAGNIQKQMGDTFNQECYNYTPKARECMVPYKGQSLPLKNVRTDWNLKSTYFAIREKKDTLFLTGRGYGHGVGLCQEGAMKMVLLGYRFEQIIKYYYKNVSIANIDSILH